MPPRPDLLFIGDSHTIALSEGAKLLGMSVEIVRFSGAKWNQGTFFYGRNGYECRGVPMGMTEIHSIRKKYGVTNILDLDVPVISTIGYHLGLLLRPLGWFNHEIYSDGSRTTAQDQVVSGAFVNDYLDHYRARHFDVAEKMSKKANLVVVAPPPAWQDQNSDIVRNLITDRLRSRGIMVYDPKDDFSDENGLLPAELLLEDNIHASPEYGAQVLSKIAELGYLKQQPNPAFISRGHTGV